MDAPQAPTITVPDFTGKELADAAAVSANGLAGDAEKGQTSIASVIATSKFCSCRA